MDSVDSSSDSYKIPIIHNNLRSHETIIQIAEALEHLSNASDDLLSRISQRISDNNKKMEEITQRLNDVSIKISKLSGVKSATQVFSSAKYPAEHVHKKYHSVFANISQPEIVRHKVKYKKSGMMNKPLEKLQLYHVKLKNAELEKRTESVGEVPHGTKYVNDILLYNTGKNLYSKELILSDLMNASRQGDRKENLDMFDIEPAPLSISERSKRTTMMNQPYIYMPNLGEVPELDVPLDLPDLPGIADDLRFESDLGPTIAPSVSFIPNLPPVLQDDFPDDSPPPPPPQIIKKEEIENITADKKPVNTQQRIEEPKIKLSETRTVEVVSNDVANSSDSKFKDENVDKNEVDAEKAPKETMVKEVLQEKPQVFDAHSELMEAIRKAGGLRNAQLRTVEKESVEKKTLNAGGNLMADLHAKLSMRRKGISGAKKQESNNIDPNSTMEKISAMIPPPAPKTENESTNTEDEEWDE